VGAEPLGGALGLTLTRWGAQTGPSRPPQLFPSLTGVQNLAPPCLLTSMPADPSSGAKAQSSDPESTPQHDPPIGLAAYARCDAGAAAPAARDPPESWAFPHGRDGVVPINPRRLHPPCRCVHSDAFCFLGGIQDRMRRSPVPGGPSPSRWTARGSHQKVVDHRVAVRLCQHRRRQRGRKHELVMTGSQRAPFARGRAREILCMPSKSGENASAPRRWATSRLPRTGVVAASPELGPCSRENKEPRRRRRDQTGLSRRALSR